MYNRSQNPPKETNSYQTLISSMIHRYIEGDLAERKIGYQEKAASSCTAGHRKPKASHSEEIERERVD
jgi:hypothetical protein